MFHFIYNNNRVGFPRERVKMIQNLNYQTSVLTILKINKNPQNYNFKDVNIEIYLEKKLI